MLKLKILSIITLFLLLVTLLSAGCNLSNDNIEESEETVDQYPLINSDTLPEWLLYSHRRAGFLAPEVSDDQADLTEDESTVDHEEENSDESATSNNGTVETVDTVNPPAQNIVSRPRSSGSPYEPGSLKDLIWHQRRADSR